MTIMVSALPIDSKGGGGWVSSRLYHKGKITELIVRNESFLSKVAWSICGILKYPFVHPVFSRYTPKICNNKNEQNTVWLNYSQTFALSLRSKSCVLVCHDLHCHVPHRLKAWLRWSEGFLLRRGERVVVLSGRDAKIVQRYYRVSPDRIENIGPFLTSGIVSFETSVTGPVKSVAFLGSLTRRENYEGLLWFVRNVLPACPDLEVSIIGERSQQHFIEHPQLRYLGFIDDLKGVISKQDLMIAPMFSRAGIKIKVIESLMEKIPVLGSRAAFSGLSRPGGGWSSDRPADWIARLNVGGIYFYDVNEGSDRWRDPN